MVVLLEKLYAVPFRFRNHVKLTDELPEVIKVTTVVFISMLV